MTHVLRSSTALLIALCAAACAPAPQGLDDLELPEDDTALRNGTSFKSGKLLNTNKRGIHFFSTLDLNGGPFDGTMLHEMVYDDGAPRMVILPSVDVVDGMLTADLEDGGHIEDRDFQHTRWYLELLATGEIVELRVDVTSDPATNTPLYAFYYELGEGEETVYTCEAPAEGPDVTAAVYRDIHVHPDGTVTRMNDSLYIGCINGAVGKASLWGYRPDYGFLFEHYGEEALLAFETTIRMIRADYCGDGVSWTQTGTPLFVEDHVGYNGGHGGPDEAVWGYGGALCLDATRVQGTTVTCGNGMVIPNCAGQAQPLFDSPDGLFWTTL